MYYKCTVYKSYLKINIQKLIYVSCEKLNFKMFIILETYVFQSVKVKWGRGGLKEYIPLP
jgi:hypothetical protein